MADTLRQLGRGLGKSARTVEFLKKRGGLLPQVDRTRGYMTTEFAFIANFTVNEEKRDMALTLAFYRQVTG